MIKINYNADKLKIEQDYISIFASGLSVLKLSSEDLNIIKNKTFLITTNFPLSLKEPEFYPHLHVWSDEKTSTFMEGYHKKRKKDCLWMTRPEAFTDQMEKTYQIISKVEYWFNKGTYSLISNFTFFWILQLILKFFPDKTILVFGLDGFIPEDSKCENGQPFIKWYDYYTDMDRRDRKFIRTKETLDNFVDDIENYHKEHPTAFKNVINCNLESRVKYLLKKIYQEVLCLSKS